MKSRFENENLKWIPFLILFVILLPFVLKSATFSYKYYLYVINLAGIYIILTIGLDILSGYTGLMSLGHAAFLALGAYFSAIMVDQLGIPFELSLFLTPLLVGCFGFVIGFPALRVQGIYLGLTTMGFGFIVKRLIIVFSSWTGGSAGLHVSDAKLFGWTINSDWENYFVIYFFVIISVIICRRLVKSKLGRAFMSIRDSEQAAIASGINLPKYKMISFFISGSFAGLAGVLFAHTSNFISTDHFDILLSVYFIVMLMIGGMGSIYGAVLGTLFIVLMENLFIPLFEDSLSKYMYLETGDFQAFMFGLIMLIFIIFQPLGFYGMWLKMKIYWKIFPFNPRKRFI